MAKKEGELTPMMKQFYDLKAKHPEALLLFRCGDFYETYADDAYEAARILGITLTRRNKSNAKEDAMAGFPHHALDTYLPKLIRAGRRVAICDQLEDPKLTKKLVKRGITELVTPGIAMQDTVLNCKENNFLCAIHFGKSAFGISLLDISTGEFLVDQGNHEYALKILNDFAPKEVLIMRGNKNSTLEQFGRDLCLFEMDDWVFSEQTARQKLHSHFNVKSMKGYGVEMLHEGLIAAGALLQYLEYTQHTQIAHINRIQRIEADKYVRLDGFTIRNLEITQPLHEGGSALVDVIDNTVSPMGARMLRRWLVFPLREKQRIDDRLDAVDYFFRQTDSRDVIDSELMQIGDMERIVAKVATGRVSPREMVQLGQALQAIKPIKVVCRQSGTEVLDRVGEKIDTLDELRDYISRTIEQDPPQLVAKGGVIRSGVNEQLDELRKIAYSGKDYLLQLQQREIERTGIMSLKIGYNNVFGYYLEVRNTFKDAVPPEWVRKQTLVNCERYITQELKEYEEKILGAEDKILALEARLYFEAVQYVQQFIQQLQQNATLVAELDCLLSFAKTAAQHRYVRPVVETDNVIDIHQGRHPVIETHLPIGEEYVPNDVLLDDKQQIIIITGPNMAGKSALLRQTALIVLLAQIGCYVPAESAHVGIVDKIFTRVGASDSLSTGESTFMVEMTEASNILNNVTDRSLVLFDELGRGTSTYDGISIAWAIVEYLHEHPGSAARTLFATHYHELNEMEHHFPRIKNYNVSVKEMNGKVIFLRKLVEGGSEHSFGIHVARLAGMPQSIVTRANELLHALEENASGVGQAGRKSNAASPAAANSSNTSMPTTANSSNTAAALSAAATQPPGGTQLSFFQLDDPVLEQVRDEILTLDINNLTPVEALCKLNEIKKIVGGKV